MKSRVYCKRLVILALVLAGCTARLSAAADTIPVQAQQTGPRTVEVTWTAAPGTATIYRQYSDESQYTEIGSTSGGSWTDRQHRSVCGDTVRYSVTIGGDEGYAATVVSDNEPTMPASWGVVTVDQSTQKIMLQWNASADTDIMGYLICEGTPSMAIDTVYGREMTQYLFAQGDVTEEYLFRICAFDSCRQASPLTDAANNMVLSVGGEPCSRTFVASWNSYQNMPSGVLRYELWLKEDDIPYRRVGQTDDGAAASLSFEVGEGCMRFSVYVRVLSADGQNVAYSNIVDEELGTTERPAYLYLRKVSVSDNGSTVTVMGQTDPAFSGSDYRVYRHVEEGAWSLVGHCSPSADGTLVWIDEGAHPADEVYTYRIGVFDGCGRNEIFTMGGSTVRPVIEQQGAQTVLRWNAYEGWEGSTSYEVMKGRTDNSGVWQTEGSTVGVEWLVDGDETDGVKYKIVAVEGADSRYRCMDSLQSTEVAYRPYVNIWMPTAFTPLESTNNKVKPLFKSVVGEGYRFTIYNRMGLVVFSTVDPQEAWDGYSKGVLQPGGAYLYKITYRQNDNTEHYLMGTVLLLY